MMMKRVLVCGLLSLAIFSASCGKKSDSSPGGGSSASNKTYKYFVYTLNYGANSISGFSLDTSTGGLTALSGSPVSLGSTAATGAYGFAVDATNRLAFASVYGTGEVKVFSINQTTGALTANASAGATASQYSNGLVIDPTNRYIYSFDYLLDKIYSFSYAASGGALTAASGSPFSATSNSGPLNGVIDSTATHLYTADVGAGTVSTYALTGTAGAVAASATSVSAATGPNAVFIAPGGKFLYSTNCNIVNSTASNTVSTYSVDSTTGALTKVGSNISPGGSKPLKMVIAPSGNFAYVAEFSNGFIAGFSINSTTGALTALSPATTSAAGLKPADLAFDPSGGNLYVVNNGANSIGQYTVDSATGALTLVAGTSYTTGQGPQNIQVVKVEQP